MCSSCGYPRHISGISGISGFKSVTTALLIGLGVGMLVGPAILSNFSGGQEYLKEVTAKGITSLRNK